MKQVYRSYDIAHHIGLQHGTVKALLLKHQEALEEFGAFEFAEDRRSVRHTRYRSEVLINSKQLMMFFLLSSNGGNTIEHKTAIVEALVTYLDTKDDNAFHPMFSDYQNEV